MRRALPQKTVSYIGHTTSISPFHTSMVTKREVLLCSGLCLSALSQVAFGQLWSSVDILTKASVRVQVEVSSDRNCLKRFSVSHHGKQIIIPAEAVADVCHVLLEDIKVVPDEVVINEGSVFSGFEIVLTTLPSAKPDESVEDSQLVRYEFGFSNDCLEMSRIFRGSENSKTGVYQLAGTWKCDTHR
jgi:hypothetical protein